MEITVINFSKGPSSFNSELWEKADKTQASLEITPRLRYSADSDYVGFQLDFLIAHEQTFYYRAGFLIGLHVEGWSDLVRSNPNVLEHKDAIESIYRTAWLVATGVVAQQTTPKGSGLVVLPPFNPDMTGNIITLPS